MDVLLAIKTKVSVRVWERQGEREREGVGERESEREGGGRKEGEECDRESVRERESQ